jgi:ATP-dependent RNA helicase SUPV3L1/SUV3
MGHDGQPDADGKVSALLGPTNTGKTHLAIERMLEHPSGVIGFPLRLLARENFEKLQKLKGRDAVALVTGEEKIVPPQARYFSCTVESMPLDRRFDFLAVDEIQHCADRERGHVFTDRLLHARGRRETMFLGADTIRPLIRELLPATELEARPRFSVLSCAGPTKLVKLPPRTAVVAFSVAEVYEIAELLRRHKGGTAVVLGALSPRTRNAQVRIYQEGEVDYLVATDAIGMGLNMDVDHVAFASLAKFDGEDRRELTAAELAQIAGRAGRFMKDGTFGTTSSARALDADVVEQIERHAFAPLQALVWRNSDLDFTSVASLRTSLDEPPPHPALVKGRVADDVRAFEALAATPAVRRVCVDEDEVRLLWDVCQVPDFRKISPEEHAAILADLFHHLSSSETLPRGWLEQRLERLDRIDGEVEDLVARIAHVRTWSYVAFRTGWAEDGRGARELARSVEDKLSDALHERLQRRFVDKLSSAVRRSRAGRALDTTVADDGSVVVEGAALGRLTGFRFDVADAPRAEAKVLGKAAAQALRQHITDRTSELVSDVDAAFTLTPDGVVRWRDEPVARLAKGPRLLAPDVVALPSTLLEPRERQRVRDRAKAFVDRHVRQRLSPLFALVEGDLEGAARGVAYQLGQSLGAVPRRDVASLVDTMAPEDRRRLHGRGVRLGWAHVYMPSLLKPAAVDVCAALRVVSGDFPRAPAMPPPGAVSYDVEEGTPASFPFACGYQVIGARAYRIDMLDKVAVDVRQRAKAGAAEVPASVLSWLGAAPAELDDVLAWCGVARNDDGSVALMKKRRR